MADRIKGITVEIGGDTTGLSKALSGVNKEIKSTQSQLKDVEKLLKLDPGNTELLRQKYELLNQEVEQTDQKLDALKEAEKQVQAQFQRGDIGKDKYDALKREIIETEAKLGNLRTEAKNAENALNGIDEKPVEEVKQAAKEAGDALEDAGKEASTFGDMLKADAIVEGVKGIASSLKDAAEDSKEYMRIMGSLEVSSQQAGYSAAETEEVYRALFGVLGDNQTAATTTANLQALGLEQSNLNQLVNATVGAWAKYGDSIPIDGLAESINETIRAGQVTGTFADVLNWGSKEGETFGVKLKENTEANKEWNDAVNSATTAEDFFNLALQQAGSDAERANLVMQAMADQGLAAAGEAWQENNEALVENNQANADFEDSMAELAEQVLPILTQITDAVTKLIDFVLNNKDALIFAITTIGTALLAWNVVSIIQDVIGVMKGLDASTKLVAASQKILNAVMNANPIMLIVSAIAALAAGFIYLWNNCEEFREFWINLWNKISEIFLAAWDAIVNFFTETIPNAWNAVVEWFSGIPEWWSNLWSSVAQFFTDIWNSITQFFQNTWNSITTFFSEAASTAISKVTEIFQKFNDWLSGIFAKDWTEQFGIFGNVINAFMQNVQNIWESIKKIFSGIIDFIAGVFTGDWERAWEGVKNIFGGIWDGLVALAKAPINGVIGLINGLISAINWAINGINSLSVTIPDWVPLIGGQTWGFNIPNIPSIPYLAKGGILSEGSAIVGEAGPELLTMMGKQAVVRPLTNQTSNTANFGSINVYINGSGQSARELAEEIAVEIENAVQRRGSVFA